MKSSVLALVALSVLVRSLCLQTVDLPALARERTVDAIQKKLIDDPQDKLNSAEAQADDEGDEGEDEEDEEDDKNDDEEDAEVDKDKDEDASGESQKSDDDKEEKQAAPPQPVKAKPAKAEADEPDGEAPDPDAPHSASSSLTGKRLGKPAAPSGGVDNSDEAPDPDAPEEDSDEAPDPDAPEQDQQAEDKSKSPRKAHRGGRHAHSSERSHRKHAEGTKEEQKPDTGDVFVNDEKVNGVYMDYEVDDKVKSIYVDYETQKEGVYVDDTKIPAAAVDADGSPAQENHTKAASSALVGEQQAEATEGVAAEMAAPLEEPSADRTQPLQETQEQPIDQPAQEPNAEELQTMEPLTTSPQLMQEQDEGELQITSPEAAKEQPRAEEQRAVVAEPRPQELQRAKPYEQPSEGKAWIPPEQSTNQPQDLLESYTYEELRNMSNQATANYSAMKVPKSLYPEAPQTPGCYMIAAKGCPDHTYIKPMMWKRDIIGEFKHDAARLETACQNRSDTMSNWCGNSVRMVWVEDESGSSPTDWLLDHPAAPPKEPKDAPKQPGCYFNAPKGCPRVKKLSSTKWRRDFLGENATLVQGEQACLGRRVDFENWCGTLEVEVLYVKPLGSADVPSTPGCWVKMPSGCPHQGQTESTSWIRDTIGEVTQRAAEDKFACMVKRWTHYNTECGVNDVMVHWIPYGEQQSQAIQEDQTESSEDELGDVWLPSTASTSNTASEEEERTKAKKGADKHRSSAKDAAAAEPVTDPAAPKEAAKAAVPEAAAPPAEELTPPQPGCYIRARHGCPSNPQFNASTWMRDVRGERSTAFELESGCLERRAQFRLSCGTDLIEVMWIKPLNESETPGKPGCYVKLPGGCPGVPEVGESMRATWTRDTVGEKQAGADTDRFSCVVKRWSHFVSWCATSNVIMHWTAPPPPPAPEEERVSADGTPESPGCYFKLPKGCKRHPHFVASTWTHDRYGEEDLGAGSSNLACQERRTQIQDWCGTKHIHVLYVPEA